MSLRVKIIPCRTDNFSYMCIDSESNAFVVDPSEFVPVDEFIKKNNLNLKYILNTHHHFDHVGGNIELKEKYGAKIVGNKNDKDRIPGIDICLTEGEFFEFNEYRAEIIDIPGHTIGHIAFYIQSENIVFTGDTLFSLGCGRIFEGTHEQMFESLNKIKKLPPETLVYCGHEYTLQNSKFCLTHDKNNQNLKNKINDIKIKLKAGLPTIPSTIKDELECNIFFRSNNIETFSKLRDLKDNF